jgi:hypothetical protein
MIALRHLTLAGIAAELSAALRRKEEARIYHWHRRTGRYPPRRTAAPDATPGVPPDP